ncbi:unnamed protein product [Laminaria digitata]
MAWYQAMKNEMQGLVESKTFTVLDKFPEGEKAIGSRWVLAYKSDAEGMITKTKARLAAKGFMQREGVDYLQTSAPTPAAATVKIVMAVAKEMSYKIYHLDVAQAFTKADSGLRGFHEASWRL